MIRLISIALLLVIISCNQGSQEVSTQENLADIVDSTAEDILTKFPFHNGTKLCDCNSFPEPSGYVNDTEDLLSDLEETELTEKIQAYRDSTSVEVAVITTPHPYGCPNWRTFGKEIGNCWGVGDSIKDNGIVLIISQSMSSTFIATGTGTYEVLTDSICQVIVNQHLLPSCKDSNYFEGIDNTLKQFKIYFN